MLMTVTVEPSGQQRPGLVYLCVFLCINDSVYVAHSECRIEAVLCWGLLMSSAFGRTLSPWLYICAYCSFSIADSANHDTAAGVKHNTHTHAHIKNTHACYSGDSLLQRHGSSHAIMRVELLHRCVFVRGRVDPVWVLWSICLNLCDPCILYEHAKV